MRCSVGVMECVLHGCDVLNKGGFAHPLCTPYSQSIQWRGVCNNSRKKKYGEEGKEKEKKYSPDLAGFELCVAGL